METNISLWSEQELNPPYLFKGTLTTQAQMLLHRLQLENRAATKLSGTSYSIG